MSRARETGLVDLEARLGETTDVVNSDCTTDPL
jgi:alpha-D-ribose 1-methylphosphonate 5-triphosphate synthase subunit PhnG